MERATSGEGVHTQVPGPPRQVRARVLVIEPDESTRWSIVTCLRPYFAVQALAAGDAGEALLHGQPVAAILISDQVTAPSTDTLAAAARHSNPDVRIVLLSAEGGEKQEPAIQPLHVEKPFALEDLARVLGLAAT